MRRSLCCVLLLLFLPSARAKDKAIVPALIVNARYVYVTSYYGSQFSPRSFPEDRQAIADLQDGLKKWKKYIVVYKQEEADLILLVRKGRVGTVRPRVVVGRRTPGEDQFPQGAGADAEFGSAQDLFAVYDARSGGVDSAALWRQYQSGGLEPPALPLLARFKKDVEDAAKKKP
jgi:hypothetical protein